MNERPSPSSFSDSTPDSVRSTVRDRYGRIVADGGSCCTPAAGCCGSATPSDAVAHELGYTAADTDSVPAGSNLGLGCGNPTAIASLQPGQVVLDLGSGAGFDAFLAARAVGAEGRVIGVDMTPEMLQRARANAAGAKAHNVEFRLGEIEHLPVADNSIDVVLSNCVVNLSPEKPRVFAEAFRVLRPGGRLAISDIVALRPLSPELRSDLELYTGCVAGAATREDLQQMLAAAGFADVRIEPKTELSGVVDSWFPGRSVGEAVASANITANKPLTA